MAKNKTQSVNQPLERTYTVPLRREFQKTVRYKRAKKAIRALKEFLARHMKSSNIRIGSHLNENIWQNGIKNPPARVRINVKKDKEGLVIAELFGKPFPVIKEERSEKTLADKVKEKAGIKETVKKKEESREKKQEKTTE